MNKVGEKELDSYFNVGNEKTKRFVYFWLELVSGEKLSLLITKIQEEDNILGQ